MPVFRCVIVEVCGKTVFISCFINTFQLLLIA